MFFSCLQSTPIFHQKSISGNPNFVAPCFEYWTGDNTTLADKTMTATLGGFAPGATYKVAMTVCAGVNTGVEASTAPTGVTLQLNNGEAVSVCTGDRIAETRFYEGTFEANATIGADGNLVIKLNVASTNAQCQLEIGNIGIGDIFTLATLSKDARRLPRL